MQDDQNFLQDLIFFVAFDVYVNFLCDKHLGSMFPLSLMVLMILQQARVIEESIDFKVGTYCGTSKRLRTHQDWEKECEQYEVVKLFDSFES